MLTSGVCFDDLRAALCWLNVVRRRLIICAPASPTEARIRIVPTIHRVESVFFEAMIRGSPFLASSSSFASHYSACSHVPAFENVAQPVSDCAALGRR